MEIRDKIIIEEGAHSIEWGHPTWAEGEPFVEQNKSIRNRYDREGGFNYAASGEIPWNDFNLMILESIRRNHFSKGEIIAIIDASSDLTYDYKRNQRKLLFMLGSVSLLNIVLLLMGNGLGGSYMKNMDSMLWFAPFGCIMWGFILGTLFALRPFKGLSYSKKYLITSLFISIVLNGFILLMAFMMLFN
jgi:hypothetical protein